MSEKLIYAEFHGDRPLTVITLDSNRRGYTEYDVEYCRREDTHYADNSGGGSLEDPILFRPTIDDSNRYWAADGTAVTFRHPDDPTVGGRRRDRKKVVPPPDKYRLKGLPGGWTESALVDLPDARCDWCSLCRDWVPDNVYSYGYRACPHIGECRKCEHYSTEDDPCDCHLKSIARVERRRRGIARRRTTLEEFEAVARDRFGEDRKKWRVVCPVCRHEAAVGDWGADKKKEAARTCLKHGLPGGCPVAGDRKDGRNADLLPVVVDFGTVRTSYMDLAPRRAEPWPPTKATKPTKSATPSGKKASASRKRARSTKTSSRSSGTS